MNLKINAYVSDHPVTAPFVKAFIAGLNRNGIGVDTYSNRPETVEKADLMIGWGMRNAKIIEHCQATGTPFVCLDHGYTPDRINFASINLNNLNAKSELDVNQFAQEDYRCFKHDWRIVPRKSSQTHEFVVGQIYNDKSLEGNDVYDWAATKVVELRLLGRHNLLFKPHPKEKEEAKNRYQEVNAPPYFATFDKACSIATHFHTFSSTAAVHAWLNGISATAISPMSMIYDAQFLEPTADNRQRWLNKISYRQYSIAELSSGLVWHLFKDQIIGKAPMSNPGTTCLYNNTLEQAA